LCRGRQYKQEWEEKQIAMHKTYFVVVFGLPLILPTK
jgi:hypothetical protein